MAEHNMALPLSLVRARLRLFDPKDSGNMVCVAISCPSVVEKDNLVKAIRIADYSYLSSNILIEDAPRLRQLALLLLCRDHKKELGEKAARAWGEERPDNDLIQLFGLNVNLHAWTCHAKRCVASIDQRWRILEIIEKLTVSEAVEDYLSGDERETLVGDLVELLHCERDRTPDNINKFSNEWNSALTTRIQPRMSESNIWHGRSSGNGTWRRNIFGCQSGSGAVESFSPPRMTKLASAAESDQPSTSGFGVSNGETFTAKSSPSDSGLSSARSTPESPAEQTKAALTRSKSRLAPTAVALRPGPSGSRRTASLSKLSSPKHATRADVAVTNSLSRSSPAVRKPDTARSSSSPALGVPRQQPRDRRPSHLRDTQLYPSLAGDPEAQGTGSDSEIPGPTLPGPPSVHAQEEDASTDDTMPKKPRDIDNLLLDYIKSDPPAKGKKLDRYIYVLWSKEREGQVKIGKTDKNADSRVKPIKNECKFTHLASVYDGEQVALPILQRLERLCHTELRNFQRIYLCKTCKKVDGSPTEHKEWFEVPQEIAVQTVQRWRKWLALSPYDKHGFLKPLWRERATGRYLETKLYGKERERIHDHHVRHERWSRWLEKPSLWEEIAFKIWSFLFKARVVSRSSVDKAIVERRSRWEVVQEGYQGLLIYLLALYIICEPWQRTFLSLLLFVLI